MDINLFNFTASKGDEVTAPSQAKQRRRKKKHTDGQQEDATEILDPPPNKSKRASSSLRNTDKKVKSSVDPNFINTDVVPKEIPHVPEAQAACSSTVDDVTLQKSPQRVGLLREKLLRLAPTSNQQNALIVHKDKQADSQPPLQTPNVEPATESENKGEDERGGEEVQIHSRGDNKPNSEQDAVANSHCDVEEEVLLPEITSGSCTQVRDSQNSKFDLHSLTACKSRSSSRLSRALLLLFLNLS